MFKNYLKIAIRNIRKNKGYAILNLVNLSLGMAVYIIIFLYVRFELSYDEFHKDHNNIYRINAHSLERDIKFASTPAHLAQTLNEEFPEVDSAARVVSQKGYFKYQNKLFNETRYYCADPQLFEIFTYPLISGNEKDFAEPFSLYITKKTAEKYFNKENPLGKTILIDNEYELVIKGVLENIPQNSYMQFDLLVSMPTLKTMRSENWLTRWVSHDFQTFVKLKQNTNRNLFEEKLKSLVRPPDVGDEKNRDVFYSQPYTEIHLSSINRGEIEPTNSVQGLSFLLIIGVFILIIACVNYLTLATAQSSKRNLEVGIRKVLGAEKRHLIFQLIGESVILSLGSFFVALILVPLFLPTYNNLLGTNLKITLLPDVILFMAVALFIGIVAGLYPAVYLSSFKPSTTLKIGAGHQRNFSFFLPRILVVVQFVITISLITCALVVYDQIDYMVTKGKRPIENPVVVIEVNDDNLKTNYNSLVNDFIRSSDIFESTVSFNNPTRITWGTGLQWEGEQKGQTIRLAHIDFNYIPFYDLKMQEGREFLQGMSTDKTESIIINETAAKESPWKNPIGKHCVINFQKCVVIGIVKDFHIKPLYEKVEPLVFRYIEDNGSWAGINYISLKINDKDIPKTINYLENTWAKYSSSAPFTFSFLDDMIDAQYREEKVINNYFIYFTIIALLLANLGLIGLTTFTSSRRKKEIGIRKAVGAKFSNVLFMLIKDVLKWVVVSIIIAFPIAYYSIDLWLQKFAYRINVNLFPFTIATLFALTIAVLSISYISIKAANTNPIESIKYE